MRLSIGHLISAAVITASCSSAFARPSNFALEFLVSRADLQSTVDIGAAIDRDLNHLVIGQPVIVDGFTRVDVTAKPLNTPGAPPVLVPGAPRAFANTQYVMDARQGLFIYECDCPGASAHRVFMNGPVGSWTGETISLPSSHFAVSRFVLGSDGTAYVLGRNMQSGALELLRAVAGTLQMSVLTLPFQLVGDLVIDIVLGEREISPGVRVGTLGLILSSFSGERFVIVFDVGPSDPIGAPLLLGPLSEREADALAIAEGSVFLADNSGSAPVIQRVIAEGKVLSTPEIIFAGVDGTAIRRLRAFLLCGVIRLVFSPEEVLSLQARTGPTILRGVGAASGTSAPVRFNSTAPGATLPGGLIGQLGWNPFLVNQRGDLGIVVLHPGALEHSVYIARDIFRSCTGDADGSFTVNFSDIVAILRAWGSGYSEFPCPPGLGDANYDLIVNFADINSTLLDFADDCR